eukprot:8123826-Pyramimonas_sp.AAC.1
MSAHPSRGSRFHWRLHRRPPWQGSHTWTRPSRHMPREGRGPIASSTDGPSGRILMGDCSHLTGIVDLQGAVPKAPVAGLAC